MRKALKFRTGGVVAAVRIALALALLATTWFGWGVPLQGGVPGQLLAGSYLAFAIVMLWLVQRSWWLAHWLQLPCFVVDVVTAFVTLWLIEAGHPGALSPFMALFVYLLLTAGIYWPGRRAILAALTIGLIYLVVGVVLLQVAGNLGDIAVFIRRLFFMIAVAGFISWGSFQLGRGRSERLDLPASGGVDAAFRELADYAMRHGEAAGVALSWMPDDEPWTLVLTAGSLGDARHRFGPEVFSAADLGESDAVLFDARRRRSLQLLAGRNVIASKGAFHHALPRHLGVLSGIIVTVQGQTGSGHLLLTDVSGPSSDQLRLARSLALEIGHALDRYAVIQMTREADRVRIRDALARDLHDSVAQSLAGASFRIEALRQTLTAQPVICDELDGLQRALEREERNVQRLILKLRDRDDPRRDCDVAAELSVTLADTAARWGVTWSIDAATDLPAVPLVMLHEFEQIVREAVANAVRHGRASHVELTVRCAAGAFDLTIVDDGSGFIARSIALYPRSIAERVAELGGKLDVARNSDKTVLRIALPTGGQV